VVDRAIDAAGSLPPDLAMRLAVLVGAADAPSRDHVVRRLRSLRYSNDMTSSGAAIVHGAVLIWRQPEGWTPERVRRLAAATHAHLDGAISVASTRVDTTDQRRAIDDVSAHEPLDDLEPALDGDEVMALLAIGPGTEVGEAIGFLRELRLTEGPVEASVAAERLEAWWSRRGARR
jgi:poly(A) polymerase